MNVALTYNMKREDGTKPEDYFSECDSADTIDAIAAALCRRGHIVQWVDADQPSLISYFRKNRVDIVFNIAEGTVAVSENPRFQRYWNASIYLTRAQMRFLLRSH